MKDFGKTYNKNKSIYVNKLLRKNSYQRFKFCDRTLFAPDAHFIFFKSSASSSVFSYSFVILFSFALRYSEGR